MKKNPVRNHVYAGILFSAVLLAFTSTPVFAQQTQTRGLREHQQSIISVAPAFHPQAESLARHAGDATFQHAPANYHVFSTANAGEDAGVELITLNFAGETRLTAIESKSKDFVIEGGTCHEGNSYRQGDSCSLLVRFDPQGPGHRLGHLEITHSAEAEPLYVGLVGNGYAPVISFTPAQITTVPASVSAGIGTVKSVTSLAIDGGDNLYIADTGNNLVKKMDSTGSIVNAANSPIATPASITADSFGIAYTLNTTGSTYYFSTYYPWGSETAYGYTHTAATCTVSAPCAFSTVGMSSPANVSIDANDNLFFEEGTKGAAEMPVGGISGGSGTFNLWYLSDQFAYSSGSPGSFAADAYGDLYTDYNFVSTGTCFLLEEPLYNAEYSPTANRVAGGNACGFSGDGGQAREAEISSSIGQMAFDAAGDLYFADSGNQRVRRIDATTGVIHTIAGNGTAGYTGDGGAATAATLSKPTGLAVDSQGQVYILSNAPSVGPTQALRKVGQNGYLSFGSQTIASTSAANTVLVSNTGNSQMTLTHMAISGVNAAEFSVDPNTTSCNLTAGANLPSGQSCQIGVIFAPKAAGTRTASLVLLDNTVHRTDTVILNGTSILATPTFKITSPTAGQVFPSGSSVTFTVTVTGVSGLPAPTGTVKFGVDGVLHGSPVTLSSGTATVTLTGLASGSHTLSTSYSGDTNYAAAGPLIESITISAPAATRVSLTRETGASKLCKSAEFAIEVSSKSPGLPTGKITLLDGAKVLASGTLVKGKATLRANLFGIGKASLVAHYAGDAHHSPGKSATLKVTTTKTPPCQVK